MDYRILIVDDDPAIAGLVRIYLNGADDYVTKPFHPLELVMRIKSLLRRPWKLALGPQPPPIRAIFPGKEPQL